MLDKIIKYKFWIATGLGLVVAIVLFVVLVRPLAARNEVDRKEFKQRVRTLEKIAARPELYNEFYIRQIDARKKELDLQKNKLDSLLKEWHQPLERSFTDIDGKVITDAGQWLPRYNSECARLIANLQKARIELPGDGKAMFDFERWEGTLPTRDEMALAYHNFWLYEGMTNVLVRANEGKRRLPRISGFRMGDGNVEGPLPPSFNTNFVAVDFEVSGTMQFTHLPDLIKIMQSSPELVLEIDSVDIVRSSTHIIGSYNRPGPGAPGAPGTGEGAEVEEIDDLVDVSIHGHIVEYKVVSILKTQARQRPRQFGKRPRGQQQPGKPFGK